MQVVVHELRVVTRSGLDDEAEAIGRSVWVRGRKRGSGGNVLLSTDSKSERLNQKGRASVFGSSKVVDHAFFVTRVCLKKKKTKKKNHTHIHTKQ